ncbi:MAG: peptidoglycan-binding protein [Oscillospiraceae bacterium]|jgi:peptidoglycan hydrolase-like protein with peptidoglycan-binding domain|nr:peptidoglycan-binding protein [Oscillospiraceae bacterium]
MNGYLKIAAFNENIARPLGGALVQVLGGDGKVLEEVRTDDSGQTAGVPLPSPPTDYSLQPGSPQPYSLYDVRVNADGFGEVTVRGVQLLPDEETYQDVALFPAASQGTANTEIVIPPSTLYGDYPPKEPEDEVKPLPQSTGLVVLPEPVIPEYVIVHAGVPSDSSAKDYWVPFRDYIKNCASSEIYATWPVETLRANILAIISLTLNRVYTEWYRSKGYSFTITNSTRFDQAFVYGRSIYTEISRVVDELFTNYVTKPDIRQPLFTQYCDGKTVQCPNWMTQWGSKSLGDQGYTAINILRSYYGWDVYLAQAEQVEGIPSSFPGGVLQVGSSGEAVRTVQTQLNAISNNFPAIKKVAVDGVFGQDTRRAVEKFQSVFNLPSDGLVGRSTWYKISQIYVAVTNMAATV